ncbi:putative MATE family efflux protein [Clostridium acetobutylicum]|uniref:MATE family efflux transporter n=1 Tax=Clostridium acetobutylicum TaxID=1488 RepID=UPI000D0CF38F|nr:MATE family efflux transporter [Clostridium acetobutylicum]MBC2395561.1 MATE family efflux transporter [Clostridium acetobutylicum]MBC2584225.1 MATE family efflux transporter [Clostridium acetobutylicum]NOV87580.1 putative MATE family efflux protein [Clostridium acetobutylicum]NOW14079.1 putative MATE family efflux protein [Clostridium acetobutylicum]
MVKSLATDMTEGNVSKHLIKFAIPLILGNLFQLTYNASDSIIVGRFVGKNALAAVGIANPIMNIVMFFIVGICLGASVLMSEYYGAGNVKKLRREISTTVIAGFIFTVLIIIICVIFTEPILGLVKTPKEIIPEAAIYLRIIFISLIFTFFYNIYAAALRSIGDSKNPLLFLMISAVLNVVMDIVFVVWLKMGVAGSAIATSVAEMMSCVFCIVYVHFKIPILKFSFKDMVIDKGLLRSTVNYSWATAMQQTCLYVGKFMVQGAVNPLGVNSIAAFNAVNRVDDFAFAPEQSISNAMTTFLAQNRGANKYKRIKKGFLTGMKLETLYWCILVGIVYLGSTAIMKLFVSGSEVKVISIGSYYLKLMAFFYLLPSWTNGVQGYFRGMGDMKITLRSTFSQIVGRVAFSYILAPRIGMVGIAFSCLGGWIVMLAYEVPCLIKYRRNFNNKLSESSI